MVGPPPRSFRSKARGPRVGDLKVLWPPSGGSPLSLGGERIREGVTSEGRGDGTTSTVCLPAAPLPDGAAEAGASTSTPDRDLAGCGPLSHPSLLASGPCTHRMLPPPLPGKGTWRKHKLLQVREWELPAWVLGRGPTLLCLVSLPRGGGPRGQSCCSKSPSTDFPGFTLCDRPCRWSWPLEREVITANLTKEISCCL